MATRMQQRRGTSEQWSTANPILAAGEIGYETDTNEFRIGDGINRWAVLSPFKNLADLGGTLDDYIPLTQKATPGGVATLDQYGTIPVNQLPNADALDVEVDTKVSAHSALTVGVHGIDDTANLATITWTDTQIDDAIALEITNRDAAIAAAVSDTFDSASEFTSGAITTEVLDRNAAIEAAKGLAVQEAGVYTDTEVGALSTSVTDDIATAKGEAIDASALDATAKVTQEVTDRNSAISTHNSDTTNVHGIADTAALATKVYADNAVSAHESDTTSVHGIADTSALATKSYADNAVSTHEQDTTNIHGIADTSALATKTYADNAASTAVAAAIDAAPAALNTLNELAAALGDDANYATTVTNALALKAPLASPTFTGTVAGITKAMVGLDSVENTADADKPVSSATQTALDLKAPLANPTFTGTVSGVTKTMVGLDNVNNTADADKPVSTATQTALDAKAPLASPALTGTPTAPTAAAADNSTQIATTAYADRAATTAVSAVIASSPAALDTLNELASALGNDASFSTTVTNSIATKAPLASPTFTGTVSGVTKAMVGLGSVDNTSDADKPVSTATQTALDAKAPIASPTFTGTVAGITKSMVGLGSVDNTADTEKPISTATQTALDAKAPLASPALTGTPTAPTASAGTNTTQVATTAYVRGEVSALVASAPGALDTLNELATALGNDASFSTTMTNALAGKAPLASPTFTGTVTVAASGVAFTDGTQSKEGVPSRTPIIQKTGSYTLSALTERDSMIEVSSATAVSVTIPLNSAVAYPVGTSIDILQTSTGQVSIVGTAGVTINAAPSGGANTAKLRTQWSSCTLFKRASDTWVVYGDLTA